MDHKKLEEIIKGKLQQDLKVPEGFSWAEMESGIKRPVEKQKRNRIIYLLGIVLGILIFAIFYKSNKVKNNPDTTLANTSVDSPFENFSKVSPIMVDKQESNISGSAKTNKSHNNSKDFKLGENTVQNKTRGSIYTVDPQTEHAEISIVNSPLATKKHWTNHTVKEEEKQISNLIAQESNINSISKPLVTDVVESGSKEIYNVLTKHLDKLPLYVSQVKREPEYLKLPQYKMIDKLSSISVPSKWILGISSGLNVIDYGTSSSIQGYSKILDQARSKRLGYSLGLNISYQLTDRFALHGALEHHLSREGIEYTRRDTIQISQENVPIYTTINTFSGNSHTTLGMRSTSEVQKRTIRENNQYSVSEASLRLSYVLFSKKYFDLCALGGFGMTRRQSKGKYIDSNLAIIELSDSNFLNKKSLSSVAILGLRFETDMTQILSFNWGVTYRRHLRDWTTNDEIIIRPSSLNLDVGLRVRL